MQKRQDKTQAQISQRYNNFPTLRNSSSLAKPFISLAKVEMDPNIAVADQTYPKMSLREIPAGQNHKRITSRTDSRHGNHSVFSKTSRSHFYEPKIEPKRLSNILQQGSTNSAYPHSQPSKDSEKTQPIPPIDKAKTSTKAIGYIKGYAVNSHAGPISSVNQDRICIVTNLNRSASKDNQVSFFSVYDGKEGVVKAEYFRDNFHTLLSKDIDFFKDTEKAIRNTFRRIEQGFIQSIQNKPTTSDTAINIIVIVDNSVFFIQNRDSKAVVSQGYGANFETLPTSIQEQAQKGTSGKYRYFLKNSEKFERKAEISVRRLDVQGLDFVVLGSEGLFHNLSDKTIGKRVWETLLKYPHENIHLGLGKVISVLMADAFSIPSTKNTSIIVVAFESVLSCLQGDDCLELPFVEQGQLPTQQM